MRVLLVAIALLLAGCTDAAPGEQELPDSSEGKPLPAPVNIFMIDSAAAGVSVSIPWELDPRVEYAAVGVDLSPIETVMTSTGYTVTLLHNNTQVAQKISTTYQTNVGGGGTTAFTWSERLSGPEDSLAHLAGNWTLQVEIPPQAANYAISVIANYD